LSETVRLICALAVLGAALASAVWRPHLAPEALVGGAGALLLLAIGAISLRRAEQAVRAIGPTVGFLAALLVIAEGCRREGLFEAIGARLAVAASGPPRRLLALVFAVATAVTIALGLDATVVLLTPVVLTASARPPSSSERRGDRRRRTGELAGEGERAGTGERTGEGERAGTGERTRTGEPASAGRPLAPLYACAHMANAGSLLLPVSNLTNLLAFRASGLSFAHFAGLMALPSLAAVVVEWLAFERFFAAELGAGAAWREPPPGTVQAPARAPERAPARALDRTPARAPTPTSPKPSVLPRYPLAVVALTLIGFALSSLVALDPVWVAVAGAVAITAPALASQRRTSVGRLASAIEPGFLVFVLALAVIVRAAAHDGLGSAVRAVLPDGQGLPAMLAIAGVSAVLANVLNNLPATLLLLGVLSGPAQLLAMLVGVNVGPNLAPPGSLATLLWHRVLSAAGVRTQATEFLRLGLLCVPPALALCTLLLWAALRV